MNRAFPASKPSPCILLPVLYPCSQGVIDGRELRERYLALYVRHPMCELVWKELALLLPKAEMKADLLAHCEDVSVSTCAVPVHEFQCTCGLWYTAMEMCHSYPGCILQCL